MMKPILLALLLFIPRIEAQSWLLPDEAEAALHHLHQRIIDARERVVILSPEIDGYTLKESLRKAAAKHCDLQLITNHPRSISALALFSSVSLRIAKAPVAQTLMYIDTDMTCSTNLPLSETLMRSASGMLTCKPFSAETPIAPSTPYLEE